MLYARFESILQAARERAEGTVPEVERQCAARVAENVDAVDLRDLRDRVLADARKIDSLPSMPEVLQKLDRVISDPTANAGSIASVIEQDVGLTARILRLANSAFLGASRTVSDVERAVVLLGLREIWTLALTATVHETFFKESSRTFSPRPFWEHSLTTAIGARLIAGACQDKDEDAGQPDTAFIAGLLHDIGKVTLARSESFPAAAIVDLAESGGLAIHEAEARVLGITHADLGSIVLDRWGLQEEITGAVCHHHNPGAGSRLAHIVHLADQISRGLGVVPDSSEVLDPDIVVFSEIGLSDDVLESIAYRTLQGLAEAQTVLDVDAGRGG